MARVVARLLAVVSQQATVRSAVLPRRTSVLIRSVSSSQGTVPISSLSRYLSINRLVSHALLQVQHAAVFPTSLGYWNINLLGGTKNKKVYGVSK